jgi:hypothetical protein
MWAERIDQRFQDRAPHTVKGYEGREVKRKIIFFSKERDSRLLSCSPLALKTAEGLFGY